MTRPKVDSRKLLRSARILDCSPIDLLIVYGPEPWARDGVTTAREASAPHPVEPVKIHDYQDPAP